MILRFKVTYILLNLGLLFHTVASAQGNKQSKRAFYFESALHYGFIAAHKPNMYYLVQDHFTAFEFNIGKQTHGQKKWESLYGYPDYGIMYWFSDFQNKKILGYGHGFMPYINFPIFNFSPKIYESFKLAAGVGYLTKKHNRLTNYKNFIIGSDLNAAINMHFNTTFLLHDRFNIRTSIGLTHFSNGSFRQPNIGINIPSLKIGARYNFGREEEFKRAENKPIDKSLNYSILSGFGIKEIWGRPEKEKHIVYFLETNISKPLSNKSSIAAGVDFFYDESDFILLDKDSITYSKGEIIKPGFHLAHDLKISNLSIVFLTGRYIYEKEKSDERLYTKLGIRYTFKEHLMLELSLKAHLATAEFIGYGIGYKF